MAYGSSWAVTYSAGVAKPDPLIHHAGLGIESAPPQRLKLLQLDSWPSVPQREILDITSLFHFLLFVIFWVLLNTLIVFNFKLSINVLAKFLQDVKSSCCPIVPPWCTQYNHKYTLDKANDLKTSVYWEKGPGKHKSTCYCIFYIYIVKWHRKF